MKVFTARQLAGLGILMLIGVVIAYMRLMIYRDPVAGRIEFAWPEEALRIYRWTPLFAGMIVGAALAVSGVLLQALLRNPLAEPFILGLSSGAGLGVMAAMYAAYALGTESAFLSTRAGPAIIGGLATLAVVYTLGQRRGWLDPISLVLVGVIVSAVAGAGIMFFQHLVPTGLSGEFTLWLMGNIPLSLKPMVLWMSAGLAMLGVVVGMVMGKAMDAATLGDDEAKTVGLSIGSLRLWMFVLAGTLAAVTVAIAGPIGFVGLIAPHAARLVLGPRHSPLVAGATLCGIILVVGADVARQAIDLGGGRMPIGIFTAVIGGPAFIWLLLSGRGQA